MDISIKTYSEFDDILKEKNFDIQISTLWKRINPSINICFEGDWIFYMCSIFKNITRKSLIWSKYFCSFYQKTWNIYNLIKNSNFEQDTIIDIKEDIKKEMNFLKFKDISSKISEIEIENPFINESLHFEKIGKIIEEIYKKYETEITIQYPEGWANLTKWISPDKLNSFIKDILQGIPLFWKTYKKIILPDDPRNINSLISCEIKKYNIWKLQNISWTEIELTLFCFLLSNEKEDIGKEKIIFNIIR